MKTVLVGVADNGRDAAPDESAHEAFWGEIVRAVPIVDGLHGAIVLTFRPDLHLPTHDVDGEGRWQHGSSGRWRSGLVTGNDDLVGVGTGKDGHGTDDLMPAELVRSGRRHLRGQPPWPAQNGVAQSAGWFRARPGFHTGAYRIPIDT